MLLDGTEFVQEELIMAWQIASPSKVTRDIYYNVMKGAVVGLELGSDEFIAKTEEIDATCRGILLGGAVETAAAWKAILDNLGIAEQGVKSIRNLDFTFKNSSGYEKEVKLNHELLDLMIKEKDAINGKSIAEAQAYLKTIAQNEGIIASDQDIINVLDAAATYQLDHTKITSAAIKKLDNDTVLYIEDLFGRETEALDMVLDDTAIKYQQMLQLAEDHKNELVGKKREEVQEILTQEAIAAGATQAEAEETAKMVTASLFAEKDANATLAAEELATRISQYESELSSFLEMEQAKLDIAQEYAKLIASAEYGEYDKMRDKFTKDGKLDYSKFNAWLTTTAEGRAAYAARNRAGQLSAEYKDYQNRQKEDLNSILSGIGMSTGDITSWWSDRMDSAMNALGKAETSRRGGTDWVSTITDFVKSLGFSAPNLDLSSWNFGDDLKTDLGLSDQDTASAIDAASDLKDGLEANRADLTPTFDLDQLASDANKANGIVMSSLMAAQNASIGDYINKDSELNPFMKDRWQNVYNFTQNNYSPKALSRIDIYRQTQRQLSMSRGF